MIRKETQKLGKPEINYIRVTRCVGHYNFVNPLEKGVCYTFHLPDDMKFGNRSQLSFFLDEKGDQNITASTNYPLVIAEQILLEIKKHLYSSWRGDLGLFVAFLMGNERKNRQRFLIYSIKLAEFNIREWEEELKKL